MKADPDAPPSYGESSSHAITSEPTSSLEKRPPPTPPRHLGPGSRRACIMLNRSDLLQIIGFPPDVAEHLDAVIRASWAKGVQKHKYDEGCWEWKLAGRPWLGQHNDSVASRRLVLAILTELWIIGWTLETSQLLFLHSLDRDSLFFKRISGVTTYRPYFGISFAEMDKVRVYDPPNETVRTAITTALQSWPKGIQEEKEKEQGYWQYKLRGQPWITYDQAQVVAGREVVCRLLSELDGVGYEMVGSVDMTIGNDSRDGDTLFFAGRD